MNRSILCKHRPSSRLTERACFWFRTGTYERGTLLWENSYEEKCLQF